MKINNKILAIFFAVLAAVLYAINIPFSKLLLNYVPPTMMAAFLYLGAGLGIGIVFLFVKNKEKQKTEKFTKKDLPFVFGMVVLDIAAPILLMFGLLDSASSNASLLNNFEIVATSLIALVVFKEVISKKMWFAIFLITVSSFILSFEDILSFTFSWGALLVILATLCWGLENNCTKNLSGKNTYQIVFIKGVFSGIGSLIVAICLKEPFAGGRWCVLALLLGFVAYGLSIFFYIKAQAIIGAAKTSAYYSVAPFIGTFLSFLIFNEQLKWSYFLGLAIMVMGTIIVVMDTLAKRHTHSHSHNEKASGKVITHEHEHVHYFNDENHAHVHKV